MHYHASQLTIVFTIISLLPAAVFAATPMALASKTIQQLQDIMPLIGYQDKSESAQAHAGIKQLPKNYYNRLVLLSEHIDHKKIKHSRMQQQYLGYPVFGGYAIIHSKPQQKVTMNGMIYRDLSAELGTADPSLQTRGADALRAFDAQWQASGQLSEGSVTPLVYIDEEQHAHWAYQVSVLLTSQHHIPARPTAIIDANTFDPYLAWNDMKTMLAPVKGRGYGGNSKIGKFEYGQDLPLLQISRDHQQNRCYLSNAHVRIVDMHHRQEGTAETISFPCIEPSELATQTATYWTGKNNSGYNLINGAYSPENDALYIGDIVYQMYQTWYGVYPLIQHQKPMQIVMQVHFGHAYENAFWDGSMMSFGDGGYFLYPMVSLTIAAHEISHGFTQQHSGLMYFGQSGAINESFSDMAAQAAVYYQKGNCTWQVGNEIMKKTSGVDALRYLDDPARDGISIARADQYEKGMDVHISSGVYNFLYYQLSNLPGWDPKKAFAVMLKANMDYWTPFSNFADGACGMLSAAHDLQYSVDDIKKALQAVRIDYANCVPH